MERLPETLSLFLTGTDLVALVILLAVPLALTRIIEHPPAGRPSTVVLMAEYRRRWMQEVPRRENRIVDASLLGSLRNGAAFFASGSILAIGGIFAALGQAKQLVDVAADLTSEIELRTEVWELKLLFLLLITVSAFLRFVWAHRLFGYCSVLVGAMPEQGTDEETQLAVGRAAAINISAARSFNRGIRLLYFAIAALAWFLGPVPLILATIATAMMIARREFFSESRKALLAGRGWPGPGA